MVSGHGSPWAIAPLVCHCLLIETEVGLVLVDTGLGLDDLYRARTRLPQSFLLFANPRLNPDETAIRQLERLGYSRDDVRHIIVTHLDFDHVGGVFDFPNATAHVLAPEYHAATSATHWLTQFRYRFRYRMIPSGRSPTWAIHHQVKDTWFGFDAVYPLPNLSADICLLSLPGHSPGHAGVAIQTSDGWLLHAGDAYFFRDEIHAEPPDCPLGLRLFQQCIAADNSARRWSQQRLRRLALEHASIRIFCAHDPVEFQRFNHLSI